MIGQWHKEAFVCLGWSRCLCCFERMITLDQVKRCPLSRCGNIRDAFGFRALSLRRSPEGILESTVVPVPDANIASLSSRCEHSLQSEYCEWTGVFGDVTLSKCNYEFQPPSERSENCVQCGVCLTKCPQHIQIPDHLQKLTEQMK
jgi:NAD-dependent dihydropyrimidine dehydrogenase PreA subunit